MPNTLVVRMMFCVAGFMHHPDSRLPHPAWLSRLPPSLQRYNGATSATGVLTSTPYSAATGGVGTGGVGSLLGTPQPLGFGDPSRTPLSDPYR